MDNREEMRQMIRKEIHSINNSEERVLFKELMEGVFLSLYETNQKMYERLEHRVMNDLSYDVNRYLIRTGLVERAYLDPSHHLMGTVCAEDNHRPVYTAGAIRKILGKQGKFCITSVFFQCDALKLRTILEKKDKFNGVVKLSEDFSVLLSLEASTRYLKQIEHLYHLFIKNGIPWQTVNAPYFFKMIDVYITELPTEIDDKEIIDNIFCDFGEYNQFAKYDMVPIWNIKHLKLKSFGFPIACGDHKNYEHRILIQDYGMEHSYLIEEEERIIHVRQNDNCLIATGAFSDPQKWNICVIISGRENKIDRYSYPIMMNLRKDNFSERYLSKTGQRIRTKMELERYISGFDLEEYVEYQGYDLCKRDSAAMESETYSMNFFIEDEIRDYDSSKILYLKFRNKGNHSWLIKDLASFIVSEVQRQYPEYQCRGRIL